MAATTLILSCGNTGGGCDTTEIQNTLSHLIGDNPINITVKNESVYTAKLQVGWIDEAYDTSCRKNNPSFNFDFNNCLIGHMWGKTLADFKPGDQMQATIYVSGTGYIEAILLDYQATGNEVKSYASSGKIVSSPTPTNIDLVLK